MEEERAADTDVSERCKTECQEIDYHFHIVKSLIRGGLYVLFSSEQAPSPIRLLPKKLEPIESTLLPNR